jgi:hypothetical protein
MNENAYPVDGATRDPRFLVDATLFVTAHHPAAVRDAGWAVGNDVGVQYVSRVPGPPLDGLIHDLYYLEGSPPYSRLMLPAAPAPCSS